MKFRLRTILWAFALLASAIATFGVNGIFIAAAVYLFWHSFFEKPGLNLIEFFILFGMIAVLLTLLRPAVMASNEGARVEHCRKKISRIAQAILSYRSKNGAIPPATLLAKDGTPLFSWRTMQLPFLGKQKEFGLLDLEKPWDDPVNSALVREEIPAYCCRNDVGLQLPAGATSSYFAVIGKDTAWNEMTLINGSVTDRPNQTILLIEQLDQGVAWAEPKDLTIADAMKVLTSPIPQTRMAHFSCGEYGFFRKPRPKKQTVGFHVAFADGSVRYVIPPISTKLAKSLLTPNGGEVISDKEFQDLWQPEFDYQKIYSFTLFVVISLLPIIRLGKRFKKAEVASAEASGDASHRGY